MKKKLHPMRKPSSRICHDTTELGRYTHFLPTAILPYIEHIIDVKADGNCGFRAVAGQLGMFEDDWPTVRCDMLKELEDHFDLYTTLYGSMESVVDLQDRLRWENGDAPYQHWMLMPDMGHIVASCYSVVFVLLSEVQCLTFLPLRTDHEPAVSHKVIALAFVGGNHFVQVILQPASPLPPATTVWNRFRLENANGWDEAYAQQFARFKELQLPSNVALATEIVVLD